MRPLYQQLLCLLVSVLLLVQTAGATLYPQSQLIDSEQTSQQMPAEMMDESHDCCDKAVKVCCDCDQGCACTITSAFLSRMILTFGNDRLYVSQILINPSNYQSRTSEQPERPPRS